MIDDRGATLFKYGVSYLRSLFIRTSRIISDPQTEISGSELNTHIILDNALYYLEHGNLEQALRFMNQLTGKSKHVAHDWVKEARLLLETQQASDALLAHAAANGLGSLF